MPLITNSKTRTEYDVIVVGSGAGFSCPRPKSEYKERAVFFALVRDLCTSAFYTTKQRMDEIQYKGNIPLSTFTGPPPHVLAHLGLN